jgi:hypothetical protein
VEQGCRHQGHSNPNSSDNVFTNPNTYRDPIYVTNSNSDANSFCDSDTYSNADTDTNTFSDSHGFSRWLHNGSSEEQ